MRKSQKVWLAVLFVWAAISVYFAIVLPNKAHAATQLYPDKILYYEAVDATPLDGNSPGRTYAPIDRQSAYESRMGRNVDYVTITVSGTGSDGDSAVFSIWGYTETGYAHRIYHTVTATLGTATAGPSQEWAEVFSGTDTHFLTVSIDDSGAAGNTIAKITFDKGPYKWL